MEITSETQQAGIYRITNIINGKIYIGQAINLYKRKNTHLRTLRIGKAKNSHFQAAWNKYREKSFKFEVEEFVSDLSKLTEREQYYIDTLKSYDREIGYNRARYATSGGSFKRTEEQKQAARQLTLKQMAENPPPKFENSSQSKINWEIVNEIRELYSTGEWLPKEIAEKFSLSREHTGAIIRGLEWNDGTFEPIKFRIISEDGIKDIKKTLSVVFGKNESKIKSTQELLDKYEIKSRALFIRIVENNGFLPRSCPKFFGIKYIK